MLRHFRKQYNFAVFRTPPNLSDDLIVLSYRLVHTSAGYSIALDELLSATKSEVDACILPNPSVISSTIPKESQFIDKINARRSDAIRLDVLD